MAARCEKAGRPNNEDNFHLASDLSSGTWGFNGDEVMTLSGKGCLMVVADGMGGMNAGEVASSIAVETVKAYFSPERLTKDVISSPEAIKNYVAKAIITADAAIKEEARRDAEKEGMGSTIVVAWIIGANVYIGWCGDSRAYSYNPATGMKRLSRDHSYVQELIDNHKLDPDLAFDHPNSNIITRSLGDSRQKARPDVKMFPLYNGDVILLCSDGLSGVLRDKEMEDLMAANGNSMSACLDALWNSGEQTGWHDNVTVELCQVIAGCSTKVRSGNGASDVPQKRKSRIFTPILALVCFLLGSACGYLFHDYYLVYEANKAKQEKQQRVIELQLKIYNRMKVFPEIDTVRWKDIAKYRSELMGWADTLKNKDIPDSLLANIAKKYLEINDTLQNRYRERDSVLLAGKQPSQTGFISREMERQILDKAKDEAEIANKREREKEIGSNLRGNEEDVDLVNPVEDK
jgi:serine/threonine protein phosphatase PrpC